MDETANKGCLTAENEATFWRIWQWLHDRQFTDKAPPQVRNDEGFYHVEGVIGIDERHEKKDFPLQAVMLEELLHYVATTDDPNTSADFSAHFWHRIVDIIVARLRNEDSKRKRTFQSTLIVYLWMLIEADIQS